jgi:hypothetical protein
VVEGTAVSSIADPSTGTTTSATASCPAGRVLLGGGGQVTDVAPSAGSKAATRTTVTSAPNSTTGPGTGNAITSGTGVALFSSYPATARAWKAVGIVTGPLTAGTAMSVQAYVFCGTS